MEVERELDPAAVAERCAAVIAARLRAAVEARGSAVLALSGGSTPLPLHPRLAAADVPWRSVHVVQVDERVAPDGHDERSWTAIEQRLIGPTGATGHPMPVLDDDLGAAADRYAALLADLGASAPDVAHLGLGGDGHTASLVPGDPVLGATAAVAVAGPYQGRRRMTLTAPALDRAGLLLWQVTGGGKAGALRRLLEERSGLPAHLLRRGPDVVVVADAEALPDPVLDRRGWVDPAG